MEWAFILASTFFSPPFFPFFVTTVQGRSEAFPYFDPERNFLAVLRGQGNNSLIDARQGEQQFSPDGIHLTGIIFSIDHR